MWRIPITHKKLLVSIVIGVFFLCGCNSNDQKEFKCIPPQNTFSYPADQWSASKPAATAFPMDASWKIMLNDPRVGYSSQIVAQGDDRIWMLESELLSYTPSNGQLKQYTINWQGKADIPRSLFLAKDGSLWGIGFFQEGSSPLLNRYNPKTDRFEPVVDPGNLLLTNGPAGAGVVEDSKGRFWIAVTGKGVFVYDPKTGQAQKMLSGEIENGTLTDDIAIDSKNGIWIERLQIDDLSPSIVFYEIDSGQYTILPIPPAAPNFRGLFVDSKSRLWVSDHAYWNIGSPFPKEGYEGWNLIVRSPVFITQHFPLEKYTWDRPTPIFEDSDGSIWYRSYGLVRLNPENGDWCRVIDASSVDIGIALDKQGNYWIVMDGKLYKK